MNKVFPFEINPFCAKEVACIMTIQRLSGIILLFVIIITAAIFHASYPRALSRSAAIQNAQERLQIERIDLQRQTLQRNDRLKFYGTLSVIGSFNLAVLLLAIGIAHSRIKAASVFTLRIGEQSAIPVRYKDLPRIYPIALNLSLAELEGSASDSHDKAYQISRQMIEDAANYTRALSSHAPNRLWGNEPTQTLSMAIAATTPTFAELLENGTIAPGKPLLLGYADGQPQTRELRDLKSLAIAGWQGSGKTSSTAYLIASSVFAYSVHAYILDPHQQHPESLSALIRPLTATGRVHIVNPFDTPKLIRDLTQRLDRRLAGEEPSEPGLLFVIDELARLANMECFDELVRLLERCTEETRKANITFFGSSPKWTARYFKGRADIRGCMNSMLIHKTKPSQADLLLEDSQEKQLVKGLQQPGDAILATDFAPPLCVSIPRCVKADMETIARRMRESRQEADMGIYDMPQEEERTPAFAPEVISLAERRRKNTQFAFKGLHPQDMTIDLIREQFARLKEEQPDLTQAEIASRAGLSPSVFSKILNKKQALTFDQQQRLYDALFADMRECRQFA
ncbi:hypothetical protein U14_03047 [Candidatus Moduliflexus flocculans]|uniref:HTH cro/C1-type domain-containing protein n=1 Tax=Candidatus Moduliflexus flocculans TaxID=1499966 RepID=A0A081BN35_9BACT|nr:hypothetical protein U14_03047 [Candidatus Moduliflexus flocculans]